MARDRDAHFGAREKKMLKLENTGPADKRRAVVRGQAKAARHNAWVNIGRQQKAARLAREARDRNR